MMQDLKTKLIHYTEGTLDPETMIEVDGLITQYLDDQLDPATQAQIDAVVEGHEAFATLVAENAKGKRWLEDECFPALRYADVKLPKRLSDNVRDLIADLDAWGKDPNKDEAKVVSLPAPKAASSPSWGLMAASIVGMLVITGGLIVYGLSEQERAQQIIVELTADGVNQQADLSALQSRTASLRADLAMVASDLADTKDQLSIAQNRASSFETERSQLATALADAAAAREAAESQIAKLEKSLTRLTDNLATPITTREEAEHHLTRRQDEIKRLQADHIRYADQLATLENELRVRTDDSDRLLAEFSLVSQRQNQTANGLEEAKGRIAAL